VSEISGYDRWKLQAPGDGFYDEPPDERGDDDEAMNANTYPTPAHGWTCFHCGETFPPTAEGQVNAKRHFGFDIYATPGCIEKLTAPERNLLLRIRALEDQLARYQSEDSDTDRAMVAMQADHQVALRRAEEKGYARGLRDARTYSGNAGDQHGTG
jgi:hypothetical protein